MSKLAERYGPWAVVTGASAGIGAEFARRIAERGINVVLVARRRNRLEQLASTIEDMYRAQARVAPVDLGLLFAEGLAEELRPCGVDVQALCPGGSLTEFHSVAGLDTRNFGPLARWMFATPTSVVGTSLRTLGRRVTVIPGFLNKLAVLTMRLMPRRLSTWLFGSIAGRVAAGN